MKYYIMIGLMLGLSSNEGNLNNYLDLMQSKTIDWSEIACDYQAKDQFLRYYSSKEDLLVCNFSERQGILAENFHLVDVNQDGLLDLIFQGGCPEYDRVKIYLNKGNRLVKAVDEAGKLIEFNIKKEKTAFTIRLDACCCIDNSRLSWHEITANSFEQQLIGDLYWHYAFDIPERSIFFENITAPNSISLRYEPKINDVLKKHSCEDRAVKGNLLGIFDKGTTLRLWKVQQDNSGEDWALVTIGSTAALLTGELYAQPYLSGTTSYMGWVNGAELGLR